MLYKVLITYLKACRKKVRETEWADCPTDGQMDDRRTDEEETYSPLVSSVDD